MPPRKGVPSGILEALLLKREQLKLKMYQENGHARPHFHVDYGTQNHAASYAIDTGERIEGDLHCKYDKAIVSWVGNNRDALLKTCIFNQGHIPYFLTGTIQNRYTFPCHA